MFETSGGKLLRELTKSQRQASRLFEALAVAFSPDGTRLAAKITETTNGQREFIAFYDPLSLRQQRAIPNTPGVRRLKFSPDGSWLAGVAGEHGVTIWDVDTLEVVTTIRPTADDDWQWASDVAFSPDAKQFAFAAGAAKAGELSLRATATGEVVARFVGHAAGVTAVALSPDGRRLASGDSDGSVKLWDVAAQTLLGDSADSRHAQLVSAIVFAPGGAAFATGSFDDGVCQWNGATAERVSSFAGHREIVWDVVYSPNGAQLASVDTGGLVRIWNARPPTTRLWHPGAVEDIAVTADGATVITTCADRKVRAWDVAAGTVRASIDSPLNEVGAHASADGSRIAFKIELQGARLWENERRTVDLLPDNGFLTLSPDGEFLACDDNQGATAHIWSLQTRRFVDAFQLPAGERIALAVYSPGGSLLAVATRNGIILLRDVRQQTQVATFDFGGSLETLAIAPDDLWLAAGDTGGRVRLWRLPGGSQSWEFRDASPRTLAFAHDGRTLAVGLASGAISLWNLPCRRKVATLRGHRGTVRKVAFSQTDAILVSASADHSVRIWRSAAP